MPGIFLGVKFQARVFLLVHKMKLRHTPSIPSWILGKCTQRDKFKKFVQIVGSFVKCTRKIHTL